LIGVIVLLVKVDILKEWLESLNHTQNNIYELEDISNTALSAVRENMEYTAGDVKRAASSWLMRWRFRRLRDGSWMRCDGS